MSENPFFPYQSLASELLAYLPDNTDGSHDLSHIHRVWTNVCRIQRKEGGDLKALLAATLLHDCVEVQKKSPLRAKASTLSADKAASILKHMSWSASRIELVAHAVKTHSYSAGYAPLTIEAKILQDSDRLDAIGTIGVARCFYVAGRMGSELYDFTNPNALGREYQDKRFTIEHFHTKLLKLSSGFKTVEGARLATIRHARLRDFLNNFMDEVGGGV